MPRAIPDFTRETAALARGALWICGIDEVGRGPLAGPVTAAAVRLDPDRIPEGLTDSKQLYEKVRTRLAAELEDCADVSIAHATVEEIDALNIFHASQLAMVRAAEGLGRKTDLALVDGKFVPKGLTCPAEAIVKGDCKSLSISAASIVAKVCRDRVMWDLAQQHPGYGWDRNAGYPTKEHLAALRNLGVTPHHRRSFRPVHNILYQENSITP